MDTILKSIVITGVSSGIGLSTCEKFLKNPFIFIHDSFDDRDTKVGFGGSIDVGQFFSGKTSSIFAGLEYFTPIENLSLKLEYDPTYYFPIIGKLEDYREDNGTSIERDSRVNIGLN